MAMPSEAANGGASDREADLSDARALSAYQRTWVPLEVKNEITRLQ
ncbi:hypothetical protein [Thalassobium sp. R2A62]|nr:hypothetical protein [Thalassobium sp. R2A62]EET46747.1 hypothetical protein TR2A62_2137 [Thalassobium sp. R2A62]